MKTIKTFDVKALIRDLGPMQMSVDGYINTMMESQGIDFKCNSKGLRYRQGNLAKLVDLVFNMQMFEVFGVYWSIKNGYDKKF